MPLFSDKVIPFVSCSKTSAEAWDRLAKSYANATSSRFIGLTGELTVVTHNTNNHLILHVLNEVDTEYKKLAAAVRAQDSVISFAELHDKLVEYGSFIKQEESHSIGGITANAAGYNKYRNDN
ncbi:hypothetical protein Dsin_018896 [Dipteronia sinensis]|uniref:Uncharacterized protein n=1 Tax=Dipteronia sinensis TaxID=43782 RepID=A0AAE0E284_9ROSI|nr:hypothetical protein Dsin_018896 [Dipteronia sinensis]